MRAHSGFCGKVFLSWLGQTSGAQQRQATSLLYSGEQFDTSLQQYHLRARNYNQANGQFTTLDPYAGNIYDPQSLHKYAYCHTDPVNAVDPSGEYSEYSLSSITMAASIAAGIISGIGQYNYSRNVLHASAWDSICDSLVSATMAFFAVYYAPIILAELMAGSLTALAFVSAGMGGLLMEGAELLGQAWSDQYTPMQKVAIAGKLLSIILTGYLAGISVRYSANPSFRITIKSPQGEATVVGDAKTLIPEFSNSTIDKVMASSNRSRSSQITEGARAIAKKQGHAAKLGIKSAFDGINATKANANAIILDILQNPAHRFIGDKVIDVYNAVGQGVRFEKETGFFIGFLEGELQTQ